jgi:hypothetical protein
VPDILPYHLLVPTHRRRKIPPEPEVLTDIIHFSAQIGPGNVDRILPFDKSYHLRERIFWRNRYHHMIHHHVPYFYQAHLLPRQAVKYFARLLPDLPEPQPPPVFLLGNGVVLLAPLSWKHLSFGWVWPDSVLIATLSLVGLLVGVWVLVRPAANPIVVRF